MTYEFAVHLTEVLLGLALFIASVEHLAARSTKEQVIYGARATASIWLMTGLFSLIALPLLWALSFAALWLFRGPYNGGSDRMAMLILTCLLLTKLAPTTQLKELAFGYLSLQVILSYSFRGG